MGVKDILKRKEGVIVGEDVKNVSQSLAMSNINF